jgi:hypothetical protein
VARCWGISPSVTLSAAKSLRAERLETTKVFTPAGLTLALNGDEPLVRGLVKDALRESEWPAFTAATPTARRRLALPAAVTASLVGQIAWLPNQFADPLLKEWAAASAV